MIKGISRQIVEVSDKANPYFERVLFVVRQQCKEAPPTLLNSEAHRVVNAATGYTGLRHARRMRFWKQTGLVVVGAAIGAVTMRLLLLF